MARDLSPQYLELPAVEVHMDPQRIDAAIRSHPTRFVHSRGMACPVGKVDPLDQRQPHPDHQGCTNGTIYTRAGVIQGLLVGNSKEKRPHVTGWLDAATASFTPPRYYEDGADEILLAPGDRLDLEDEDVVVTQSESVQASLGVSDQLSRPAVRVLDLVDWTGRRLVEGVDFEVRGGAIAWSGRRPAYDARTGALPVFAVRYVFRPSWYIVHLTHELRMGQEPGPDGPRAIRLPQSAIIQREYVYRSAKSDPQAVAGDPGRQQAAPT